MMRAKMKCTLCAVLTMAWAARVVLAAGLAPVETKLPARGAFAGTSMTFTPDGTAIVYYDGTGIATWDIAQRKTISTIPTREWKFMLSHDGTRIASGEDTAIRLYDAKSGRLLHALRPPHTESEPAEGQNGPFFRSMGFGERSKQFFTANLDDVQVWDVASGKMIGRIAHKEEKPDSAPGVQSYDGRWLAVARFGQAGKEILDTRTGTFTSVTAESLMDAMPRKFREYASVGLASYCFSGDGRTIFASDQFNQVLAGWSIPEGKFRSCVKIPGLVFADVSRDGMRILARYK